MTYTLQELADQVGGRVVGDPGIEITGVQPFQQAGPGDLTLAEGKDLLSRLDQTQAAAVIVPPQVEHPSKNLLPVDQPKVAFARLLDLFHRRPFQARGISPLAHIGERSRLSDEITIHPFVVVGEDVTIGRQVTLFPGVCVGNGCTIGEGSTLHPNVTLYPGVFIGARVCLHSGVVVGADGFGYAFDGSTHVKLPQVGDVVIQDDVEIGANSCVDRATFGSTIIESGVKLDNHVHIGHNCRIGANTIMVAQVGISGSVRIGRECVFAGHSGVADHVSLGDRVTVTMKTAVSKDVPSGRVVSGQPAMDHRRWMRTEAVRKRLPELYRRWMRYLDSKKDDE